MSPVDQALRQLIYVAFYAPHIGMKEVRYHQYAVLHNLLVPLD